MLTASSELAVVRIYGFLGEGQSFLTGGGLTSPGGSTILPLGLGGGRGTPAVGGGTGGLGLPGRGGCGRGGFGLGGDWGAGVLRSGSVQPSVGFC